MTAILDTRSDFSMYSRQWKSPHHELWVYSANGEYRGMVEFTAGHFVASNRLGKTIGEYTSLVGAQLAVDDWTPRVAERRELFVLTAVVLGAMVCSSIAGVALIF